MQCSYLDCEYKRPVFSKEDATYCTQCYITGYCSPDCRALDWVSHRKNICNKATETAQSNLQTSTSDISMLSQTSSTIQKKKKTLDDYEIIDQNNDTKPDLGRGTYSNVKLVREKGNLRKSYAMKILNKKQLKTSIKNEIKIQKKLNHPHIIKLYDYFEDKENVYLILEYAQKGTLAAYLKKKKKLSENEAFIFFFQTCVALDYLHKKGFIHRDLKPDNILLTEVGDIKLSDFGMSTEEVGEKNSFCGTVDYMAPEIVQKQSHDNRVDIWSVGVLLYEMLHGYPPFIAKTTEETYDKIIKRDLSYGDISESAKNLINILLQSNPNDRISLSSVFDYPWMQKYQKEFNIDYTKYIYKSTGKNQNSLENNLSFSSDFKTLDESSSQNLPSTKTPLISELTAVDSNPFTNNSSYNPLSNRAKSTPNIYQPQIASSTITTDDLQSLSKSIEKFSKPTESKVTESNPLRKTSPGYLTDLPNTFETNTYTTRTSAGNAGRNSTNKPVDVESYIQKYEIGETEEMKILNKLDNFYSTSLHKHPNEIKELAGSQEHKNKPLDTKDQNRVVNFFSNQNEEDKLRYSRQTKERNLEMSFQDNLGASVEEEHVELKVEETFGGQESLQSLPKTSISIDENHHKAAEKTEIIPKAIQNSFSPASDARKNYRSTTNEKVTQENFLTKSQEQTRFSSIQMNSSSPISRKEDRHETGKFPTIEPITSKSLATSISRKEDRHETGKFPTFEPITSKVLAKSPKKENKANLEEDEQEERVDFERKSHVLLKNFKHKLHNIHHMNSSPTAKYEEFDNQRSVSPTSFKEKVLYPSYGGKQREEKLTKVEMSPQKKFEKEKLIENPELAKNWLNKKTADKDLDYSFMPKSLIYSNKTMDQSMAELKKKTQQLELIMGEKELTPERVSRSSWKNIQDNPIQDESMQQQNSGGLFSKLLAMIGCVERDSKGRPVNTMQKPKDKK